LIINATARRLPCSQRATTGRGNYRRHLTKTHRAEVSNHSTTFTNWARFADQTSCFHIWTTLYIAGPPAKIVWVTLPNTLVSGVGEKLIPSTAKAVVTRGNIKHLTAYLGLHYPSESGSEALASEFSDQRGNISSRERIVAGFPSTSGKVFVAIEEC